MSQAAEGFANHPVEVALADVRAALEQVAETPMWSLRPTQIVELLGQAHSAVSQLHSLQVRLAAEADRHEIPKQQGAPNLASWLRAQLVVRPNEASRLKVLSSALAGEFTATGAALAAGQISIEHAAVIVASVRALPTKVPAHTRRAAQAALLEQAASFDPGDLRRLGRRILAVVDPDLADRLLAKQLDKDEADTRNELRISPDGSGGASLRGSLDAEGEAIVKAALDPLAAPLPHGPQGPDARGAAERLGDALVELCRRALGQGDLPDNGGEKPTVVVTINIDALRDRTRAGLLDTGDVISPEAARRWACDAKIIPAVLGSAGQPLDVGRANRLFTGPLRRALVLRDGGCAFPSCDRPPVWCTGHHIVHWADGGRTCLANGVLLCGHHHVVVHHGGWTIKMGPHGIPDFIPPPWIDPHQTALRNTRYHLRR